MKQSQLSLVLLVLLSTVFSSAPNSFAASADDDSPDKAAWDKMVSLNKKAFAAIQARKFSVAKDALLEALSVGKDAGLASSEMMARTHVHLAAVFVTGEKNRDKGVDEFMLALKIKPTITMTSQLDTPELKSTYLIARRQLGLSSGADTKPVAATPPASPGPPEPDQPTEAAPATSVPKPTVTAPALVARPATNKTTTVTEPGDRGHEGESLAADADASKVAEDDDDRLSHRRDVGAIWVSFAGGSGIAYHAKENLDSGATDPQGNAIRSLAGFTPAGQFQLEFELGYQLNKDLSISAMGRYQHAAADALGAAIHPVLTAAMAAYLRARYAFLTEGNFQTYGSAGAGGGNNFLVIINKQCDAGQPGCRLPHSDTLHGGPVGVLVGIGAIYHLSRNFGIFVDVNEILTLPKFMALTEVNLGLAIAYQPKKTGPSGPVEKPSDAD